MYADPPPPPSPPPAGTWRSCLLSLAPTCLTRTPRLSCSSWRAASRWPQTPWQRGLLQPARWVEGGGEGCYSQPGDGVGGGASASNWQGWALQPARCVSGEQVRLGVTPTRPPYPPPPSLTPPTHTLSPLPTSPPAHLNPPPSGSGPHPPPSFPLPLPPPPSGSGASVSRAQLLPPAAAGHQPHGSAAADRAGEAVCLLGGRIWGQLSLREQV